MKARPPHASGGRRVDLHTHTVFSDGVLTPEELVARAAGRGLAALAITDHDTVEGLARARAAAPPELEVIPGIEISSTYEEADLHLLGYCIDPGHEPLLARLREFGIERRDRARRIVERLRELGIGVDEQAILAAAGPGVVGRPHVAAALVSGGHVSDMDDAFRRYLGVRGSAYVPRARFPVEEAIELIHAANGVSVLAHPGPLLAEPVVERLVGAGLRGIEVWHPLHNPSTTRRYRGLARRLGLLETGGTDFHGPWGYDLGDLEVPLAVVERLKRTAGVTG